MEFDRHYGYLHVDFIFFSLLLLAGLYFTAANVYANERGDFSDACLDDVPAGCLHGTLNKKESLMAMESDICTVYTHICITIHMVFD